MICQECRRAADVLAGKDPTANVTGPPLERQAEKLHARCRGGTWCDCQHVVPPRGVQGW